MTYLNSWKQYLTEQSQDVTQLMMQRRAIMQDALAKLNEISGTGDVDADETVTSVDNAVCTAYIEFCNNMITLAKSATPGAPVSDLSWGTEIVAMINRIKTDVTY